MSGSRSSGRPAAVSRPAFVFIAPQVISRTNLFEAICAGLARSCLSFSSFAQTIGARPARPGIPACRSQSGTVSCVLGVGATGKRRKRARHSISGMGEE